MRVVLIESLFFIYDFMSFLHTKNIKKSNYINETGFFPQLKTFLQLKMILDIMYMIYIYIYIYMVYIWYILLLYGKVSPIYMYIISYYDSMIVTLIYVYFNIL
jgi:hypothetical protein